MRAKLFFGDKKLVRLLTAELKRDVVPSCRLDIDGRIHDHWELLSDKEWVSDVNLDRIERHHWRSNPQESASLYFGRAKWWWSNQKYLW